MDCVGFEPTTAAAFLEKAYLDDRDVNSTILAHGLQNNRFTSGLEYEPLI